MSLTGDPDRPPMKAGVGTADLMCGMYVAVGIQAAVHARQTLGRWPPFSGCTGSR